MTETEYVNIAVSEGAWIDYLWKIVYIEEGTEPSTSVKELKKLGWAVQYEIR